MREFETGSINMSDSWHLVTPLKDTWAACTLSVSEGGEQSDWWKGKVNMDLKTYGYGCWKEWLKASFNLIQSEYIVVSFSAHKIMIAIRWTSHNPKTYRNWKFNIGLGLGSQKITFRNYIFQDEISEQLPLLIPLICVGNLVSTKSQESWVDIIPWLELLVFFNIPLTSSKTETRIEPKLVSEYRRR